jgi:GT2 family glycosyltransferase
MFVKSKLFHDLGGFDADYFAHMEEIDLCWRMKRAGYSVMSQPLATVRHVGGGTLDYQNPKKTFLNFRNSFYTIYKNEPMSKLLWLIPVRLLLDGVAGIVFLFKGQFAQIGAILKAHFAFYGSIGHLNQKKKAYNDRIKQHSIGAKNTKGIYKKSIIVSHYIFRKKFFSELKK